MATKAAPAKATPPTIRKRKPLKWTVVLHIVNGRARPQGDWRTQMRVDDEVDFKSPDGKVLVEFEPIDAVDINGKPVKLAPFGSKQLSIEGAKQKYRVVNSCKAVMHCYIIKPDGTKLGYGKEDADEDPGTNICTGGGNSPVKC